MEPIYPSIEIGSHVELNLLDREGHKDRLSADIVPDESADFAQGFLGASTPLAKVLIGERAGTVIPYLKDDIYAIEIIEVSASRVKPSENMKEKRQAEMEKTRRAVEHTNAVNFASSFSGKWGDYDPDSLPEDETPKKPENKTQ